MRELSRFTQTGFKALCLMFFLLGGLQLNAQNADDFCNCPDGFLTRVPPQAIKNGRIIASDLFRFSRIPAHPPVVNRCFIIDKPLVFNEPWERYLVRCHFTMKPGSSIVILPSSGGFHLREGSISGCGQNWNGIITQSGSQLELEKSEVYDAITAVNIANGSNVALKGTTFENCSFGVQVEQDAIITGTPIYGCTFENCIVGVGNNGNIFVGSELAPNHFKKCANGVISRDGNLFLNNSVFDSCYVALSTSNNESIEVKNSQFLECNAGISDINSNINIEHNVFKKILLAAIDLKGHSMRSIEIRDNEINAWNGIELSNIFSDHLFVSDNKITASGPFLSAISILNVAAKDAAIELNTISSDQTITSSDGILVTNSSGINVSNNHISTKSQIGVGIEIVGTNNSIFDQNTIYGGSTEMGIVVENSQVDVVCNELFNHINGIIIKGFSKSDISTNVFTDSDVGLTFDFNAISGPQIHSGNLWFGDFSAAGAYHYNPNKNFYSLSNFFVNKATTFALPNRVFPNGWFEDKNGRTKECEIGGKATTENPTKVSLDKEFNQILLEKNIYTDADNRALNFEAARYLLESGIYASKTETNLLTGYETKTLEHLNQSRNNIKNLIDYDSHAMIEYKNQQNELENVLRKLSHLKNHSAETSADTKTQQIEFNLQLKNLLQKTKAQRSQLLDEMAKKSETIKMDLNKIQANEIAVTNEVFIQKMHLKILEEGVNSISEKEKEEIEKIAQSNPNANGMIVYKARNLLYETPKFPTATPIQNIDLAYISSEPIDKEPFELEVFPNPASEFLNISSLEDFTSYKVVSLEGKLVKRGVLNNNPINIQDLNQGYYFIKIQTESGEMLKKKFAVIR